MSGNFDSYRIVKVGVENYAMFSDLLYWRQNGTQRPQQNEEIPEERKRELQNQNLYVYAVETAHIFTGWISLIYLPKISKFHRGHVYVDELWVAPPYRRKGYAKALMTQADQLARTLQASGIRLYVNTENPCAKKLYERCGFHNQGTACFMEKILSFQTVKNDDTFHNTSQ